MAEADEREATQAATAADAEGAENTALIMESVKNQTETDDKDLSPDGLAYNVSNFELEVERFLEVESWNIEHGIEITDEVEEKIVEEMKAAQAAGDDRRGKIKQSFEHAADELEGAEKALQDLNLRLEQSARDAEAASSAEASGTLPDGAAPHLTLPSTASSERSNPYTEYKALLSSRSTSSARSDGDPGEASTVFSEATGLDVDNAAVRSRILKLRSESALLRESLKAGANGRGDFSAFRKALVTKN